MTQRNYIFSLFFVLSVLIGCKGTPDRGIVRVIGVTKNLNGTMVYLSQNSEKIDSVIIKNGEFALSGEVWNNALTELEFQSRGILDSSHNSRTWRYFNTFF